MQTELELLKIKRRRPQLIRVEKAAQLKEGRILQQKYRDSYNQWRSRVDSEIVTLDEDR